MVPLAITLSAGGSCKGSRGDRLQVEDSQVELLNTEAEHGAQQHSSGAELLDTASWRTGLVVVK